MGTPNNGFRCCRLCSRLRLCSTLSLSLLESPELNVKSRAARDGEDEDRRGPVHDEEAANRHPHSHQGPRPRCKSSNSPLLYPKMSRLYA